MANKRQVSRVTGIVRQIGHRGAHIVLPGDWIGSFATATLSRGSKKDSLRKLVSNFGNGGHLILPLSWKGKMVTVTIE